MCGVGAAAPIRMATRMPSVQRLAVVHAKQQSKAGFKPDQPRWPKDSGDESGRWSGGAGTTPGTEDGSSSPTRGGHHFVPRQIYKNLPLRPETRKVFEQGVTGRLNAGSHGGSKEHHIYNDAVAEQLERFKAENGVEPERMTPDHARKFLDEVRRSTDPRIRGLNMRIYMREIMFWFRRLRRVDE